MRFLLKVLDGTGSNGSPTRTQCRHGSILKLDLVICVGLFFTLPITYSKGTMVPTLVPTMKLPSKLDGQFTS
jgi:hypothetical protein